MSIPKFLNELLDARSPTGFEYEAQAIVDNFYTYDIEAGDIDGDILNFSLLSAPSGMTIDEGRGIIQWFPTASQVGLQSVEILVTDGQGGFLTQNYQIDVLADAPNEPPSITSTPVFSAAVGELYEYKVTAADSNGEMLSFSLGLAPTGMTIEPSTGLIQWC